MKKKDSYLTSTIQYVFFYQTAQTEIVRYNYTVDLVKFLNYIQELNMKGPYIGLRDCVK